MITLFLYLVYLSLLMGVGYLTNRLLVPVFGRWWRLFVAPGILIHELAHVVACVFVGAEVHEVNVWKPTGGHVVHGPPKLRLIGDVLISLAPSLLMTLALVLLAPIVAAPLNDSIFLHTLPGSIPGFVSGAIDSVSAFFQGVEYRNVITWLIFYLILNVAVAIAPSGQDLKNATWAFVALIILAGGFTLLSDQLFLVDPRELWPFFAVGILFLLIALVMAALLRLLWEVTRKIRKTLLS